MNSAFTTDEQALRNGVAAAPDDDAPRLIYADWLDENNQAERAELIRVQIELAHLPKWKDCETWARYQGLVERESQLLVQHQETWAGKTFPVEDSVSELLRCPAVQFRRGFVECGHFRFEHLCTHSHELLAHPVLRDLTVSEVDNDTLTHVLAMRLVTRMHALHFSSRGSHNANWELLASAPPLPNLRTLSLHFGRMLLEAHAILIGRTEALAGVTDLTFNVHHQAHALEPILNGVAFQQLKRLATYANGYSPYFPDIFGYPCLTTLEHLLLDGYFMRHDVIEELAQAPFWTTLRTLSLRTHELSAKSVTLLGTMHAPMLEELSLEGNLPRANEALLGPLLRNVKHLELQAQHSLGVNFLRHVGSSEYTRALRKLSIRRMTAFGATIGDDFAEAIAESSFRGLYELDLSRMGLTTRGAKALLQSSQLDHLCSVILLASSIDDATLAALRERFPNVLYSFI